MLGHVNCNWLLVVVMTELGRSAKGLCELSGRTEPVVGDVIVALIEMGTLHILLCLKLH